jgi:hypothetical protein
MAETEVETILREIRERVLSGQRAGHDVAAPNASMSNGGNGAGELSSSAQSSRGQIAPPGNRETLAAGNLSLINSYLTTTARAWDRLPPVVSNRSGFVARVELWLKRNLKRATRWYSWEQVNFNAAVHHALRDLLRVFSNYEAELRNLRAQLAAAETQAVARATQEAAQVKELAEALAAQSSAHASELQALSRANETRNQQVDAQLAALVSELRERVAHLQDEQRVCYKQLALETTEAAVLEDRARRKTETLLEELQKRVERLEKRKSDES